MVYILGFGDNLSKMDMIVLRLKSLRVEAEDRCFIINIFNLPSNQY